MRKNNQPIDINQLNHIFDDDGKFIQETLLFFLSSAQPLFQEIDEGVKQRNFDTLARVAHTLTGSSSNVAAHEIARLSFKMEQAATEQNWDKIRTLYKSLGIAFKEVEECIQAFPKQ